MPMEKLTDALVRLHEEIAGLRTDVQQLSAKVDALQGAAPQKPPVAAQTQAHASSASARNDATTYYGVDYGRALSEKERAYLAKLHGTDAEEKKAPATHTKQREAVAERATEQTASAPQQSSVPQQSDVFVRFFRWLAKDWPMKVGGFFVIAAVGWFTVYAVAEDLISETGRVIVGYVFAIMAILFGVLRAQKERVQGNLFLVIGIAAMLIATLAGIEYDILPATLGLFVMLVSVGFVTLMSLKQHSFALTGSMIFFGAVIPLFFFDDTGINVIFVYLFILTLGTVWVVQYTQWRSLTMMMLLLSSFYSIGYILDGGDVTSLNNVIFAILFSLVFYGANIASVIRSQKMHALDIITAVGTGIMFLIWMLNFAEEEFHGVLLLFGTLMFALASYVVFLYYRRKEPTMLYAGVSASLLVAATAQFLDGPILATTYIIEAATVIILFVYLMRERITTQYQMLCAVLYALPALVAFGYAGDIYEFCARAADHEMYTVGAEKAPELLVVFVACVSTYGIAFAIMRFFPHARQSAHAFFFRLFAYLAGAYSIAVVWCTTHLILDPFVYYDIATVISLVIYTFVGVVFYYLGIKNEYAAYKYVAGVLFAIVVARVVSYEFWHMDRMMLTVMLFLVGPLLISTAFIRKPKQ